MKMLTPKDLRNHQFQMSGRNGYLAADVDDYMDEVYNSYDQMFRENAEIVRKLQVLADRLAKYKSIRTMRRTSGTRSSKHSA